MLNLRVVVVALVLIPSIASAQGRSKVRGEKEADWKSLDKETKGNNSGLQLSNKDFENMSPVKLLIDKRKDLKLTDDQLKQLKAQDEKLKETNKPLFKVLDSLRLMMKQTPNPNDDDRARALSARLSLGGLLNDFSASYKAATDEATTVLDDTQKPKAAELLAQLHTDTEELIKEKVSGGGGRRGG